MSTTKTITGKPGQTAFDIALQEYGSVEGLRWLMEDNTINSQQIVVPQTVTGETLVIRKDTYKNKKVVDYYSKPVVTY
jgi:hypothetical protein